jgi:hypothetical protein
LIAQVEVGRTVRNDVQYQTREVTEIELDAILKAAQALLGEIQQQVDKACP